MKLYSFWRMDAYILRFTHGSHIPPHTDPTPGNKHYRLNIILKPAHRGGQFWAQKTIFNLGRIIFFRPDINKHGLSQVWGRRYVLSLGFRI